MNKTELDFLNNITESAIQTDLGLSVVDFSSKHIKVRNSPFTGGDSFNPDLTPWIIDVLNTAQDYSIRRTTMISGAQTSKSACGQGILGYLIATLSNKDILYNYESDKKAKNEWNTRIEPALKKSPIIANLWPEKNKGKDIDNTVTFNNNNTVIYQGVESESNVTSHSYGYIINDEVHDYKAGRLQDIYNRARAFNGKEKIFNFSTCSNEGDQLNIEWENSTKQEWQWKCPKCGKYHTPEIRKNSDGSGPNYKIKRNGNHVDSYETKKTIFYKFPCCGYIIGGNSVKDYNSIKSKVIELNKNGKYSEPAKGSNLAIRGHRVSGIVSHTIDWYDNIIIPFDNAQYALDEHRDILPLKQWMNEVEVTFFKDKRNEIKIKPLNIKKEVVKNKDGIADRELRVMSCDYQQGNNGDSKHFIVVIRDHKIDRSLLVYENRVNTGEELNQLAIEYNVNLVMIDSGYSPQDVYNVCLDYNSNDKLWVALKGTSQNYEHAKAPKQRFYSSYKTKEVIDQLNGQNIGYCRLVLYNRHELHHYLQSMKNDTLSYRWEIPSDISENYQKQINSMVLKEKKYKDGNIITWDNEGRKNDYFACEAYQMLAWKMYVMQFADNGQPLVSSIKEPELKNIVIDEQEPPF